MGNVVVYYGSHTIKYGKLNLELPKGTYYRIVESKYNDGVHKVGSRLQNESFIGYVIPMTPTKEFLKIVSRAKKDICQTAGQVSF